MGTGTSTRTNMIERHPLCVVPGALCPRPSFEAGPKRGRHLRMRLILLQQTGLILRCAADALAFAAPRRMDVSEAQHLGRQQRGEVRP